MSASSSAPELLVRLPVAGSEAPASGTLLTAVRLCIHWSLVRDAGLPSDSFPDGSKEGH